MKVLHLGKYYPPFSGGIENFMQDLLESQVKSGLTVAAIVHHHEKRFFRTKKENCEGVLIYRVPCFGSFIYAPVSPQFPLELIRIIRTFKPDVIHAHMPNTSAFWLFLFQHVKKIPIVIHWHSDVIQSGIDSRLKLAYPFYRPFEQRLLKYAKAVIATSLPYLKTSIPLKRWKSKTHIIPLGIRDKKPSPPACAMKWAENIWGTRATRIICIGRLTYYKGHQKLIGALNKSHPVRVVLVGDGELKDRIASDIHLKKIADQCLLLGHLDSAKLEALLRTAGCLVLPSIERTEAFGVVLLEAMRAGKPTIVFNVEGSGMGMVVREKVTGFKLDLNDESALETMLEYASHRPDLLEEMGKNARIRFQEKFRIGRISQSIHRLYRQVLK